MLPLRLCSIACVTEPINNVLHELFHGSLELIRARILRVDRLALGIHEMELTESTVSGVHDKSAHLGDFDLYLKDMWQRTQGQWSATRELR